MKYLLLASVLLAGTAHAADTKPILQSIHECDGPGFADRQDVKLAFTVTPEGTVSDIRIAQSSGSAKADARVVKCVSGYTYQPATHDGIPVAHPTTFTFHWGRVEDMEGTRKAFARLERDADRRCQKLYPMNRALIPASQSISLIVVERNASGQVQMNVRQSAGEEADRKAMSCLTDLLKDHEDLPVAFSRGIAIDWMHRR